MRRRPLQGALAVLALVTSVLKAQVDVPNAPMQCYCRGVYIGTFTSGPSCRDRCPDSAAPSQPAYDAGAAQRSAEAEAARRQQAEAERQRKEREERRRQEEFDASQRELCHGLKGGSCDDEGPGLKSGTAGDLELKGVGDVEDDNLRTPGLEGKTAGDTEIKKSFRAKARRLWGDGSGSPSAKAWSQLICGASLFGASLTVARSAVSDNDVERVRYLGEETIGALEGREYGEPCPPASKMPRPAGRTDFSKTAAVKFYRAAAAETERQAERILADNKSLAQPGADESLSKARADKAAAQGRLGRIQRLNETATQHPETADALLAALDSRPE